MQDALAIGRVFGALPWQILRPPTGELTMLVQRSVYR